jgi:phosphonoacetaldehyde hydrolase
MSGVEAIIFDWAGTTVDFGSLAPVRAVTDLFRREGIDVSDADVRRDMGLFKRDHIRKILESPHVVEAWHERTGQSPSESDVDYFFDRFLPLQFDILAEHSKVIDGIPQLCEDLRSQDVRIGGTTGYTRPMLNLLLESAAKQGYSPDLSLCPDDVGGGRPLPWMCWRIALDFKVNSAATVVKIGDTPTDIHEGRNAGMWTVGITTTGNEVGVSEAEFAALSSDEAARRIEAAAERLKAAGAHYIVERAAAVHPIIHEIAHRLMAGERP